MLKENDVHYIKLKPFPKNSFTEFRFKKIHNVESDTWYKVVAIEEDSFDKDSFNYAIPSLSKKKGIVFVSQNEVSIISNSYPFICETSKPLPLI